MKRNNLYSPAQIGKVLLVCLDLAVLILLRPYIFSQKPVRTMAVGISDAPIAFVATGAVNQPVLIKKNENVVKKNAPIVKKIRSIPKGVTHKNTKIRAPKRQVGDLDD